MAENDLIAVIGDAHGCCNTLSDLCAELKKETPEIYSVGDLVDRGKYPKDTVQYCIDNDIKCVRGNHEDILLRALEHPEARLNSLSGYTNFTVAMSLGGKTTMKSYIGSSDVDDFSEYKYEIIRLKHFAYINSFPLKFEFEGVVITHAGIVKGEDRYNWMWNRNTPSKIGKFQIFGHTPLEEPEYSENHYIAIDTGCVYGRKLTAVIVNKITGRVQKVVTCPLDPRDI